MAVRYERQDQIAVITLDRPSSLNAINAELSQELGESWERFAREDDALVAILTGAGRAFCAGLDMKQAAEAVRSGDQQSGLPAGMSMRPSNSAARLNPRTILKPVIAAVNGPAAGGGLLFVLSCDLVIASETAQFVVPFAARGRGGASAALELARKTSINVAAYAALSAGRISAEMALRLGIAHEVVPPDDLMPRALELAEKIAGYSQPSVSAIKQALVRAMDAGIVQAMSEVGQLEQQARSAGDMREGTLAFDEKRRAQYSQDK